MSTASKPVPIVIPPDLGDQIDLAASLTNFSKAEIMRMAMRIGLEDLRRVDYNIASAVVDKAKGSAVQPIAGAITTTSVETTGTTILTAKPVPPAPPSKIHQLPITHWAPDVPKAAETAPLYQAKKRARGKD